MTKGVGSTEYLRSKPEQQMKALQQAQRVWIALDTQQLVATLAAYVKQRPQLRLRVLGRMEAMWMGEVVNLPRHGIEMLTILALAEPAGSTGDELRERLYGDSDSGKAGLRKLLERLRQLMPGVIVFDGVNYRLNVLRERLDADVLLVRDTSLACPELALLQHAAEYTNKTLLPGNEAAWIRGEREAFRLRGVDLWRAVAHLACNCNDLDLAVRAYQAARALGPLQERVIAEAMSLDLELGWPVQAITKFLEYRQLLDETLGLDPPLIVEQLYRQALGV